MNHWSQRPSSPYTQSSGSTAVTPPNNCEPDIPTHFIIGRKPYPLAPLEKALRSELGLRFGREKRQVDVFIPGDSLMSRTHFRLYRAHGLLFISDLGSAWGTRVGGAVVGSEGVRLDAGQCVLAGQTWLAFCDESGRTTVPAETLADLTWRQSQFHSGRAMQSFIGFGRTKIRELVQEHEPVVHGGGQEAFFDSQF